MFTKPKRGIALITVLMIAVVMMILLGSFVKVNQQHFGILNTDLHHVATTEAARSAFDYCLYRLERNRNWGVAEFAGNADPSVAGMMDIKTIAGSHKLTGTVLESGAEFEVELLNNINNKSAVDGIQGGQCRIRITAQRGTARTTREAVMQTAPLFDGSVVASKNINIDAEKLIVSSTDPMRNRIRAKNNISVPDYDGGRLKFKAAEKATEEGVLWAKGGIKSGGKSLEDSAVAQEASRITGGQFLPHADTHHDIYDLQVEEVKTNKGSIFVESGIYVFNRRAVEYDTESGPKAVSIPVLERREWAVDSNGQISNSGDIREVWFPKGSLPENLWSANFRISGLSAEEGIHPVDGNEFAIGDTDGDGLGGGITVNFNSLDETLKEEQLEYKPPSIVLDSRYNIEVNGDFGVTSFDPDHYPTIKFQDPTTKIVDGGDVDNGAIANTNLDVESDNASNSSGSGFMSGSITTRAADGKPGSIYIAGAISGSGKLLAEGNVTVRNTYANVSSTEESDLSIFAGGSVTLRPQKARGIDANSIFATSSAEAQGTTRFKGLVFARDDVFIEADRNPDENVVEKGDIWIEGAVVARNGSVNVMSARNVNFKYNPDYLDTILQSAPESRVRLERVVWKEI
jgi:hypothetical protein